MFFDKANPIVIETLIGATIGILRPLGKNLGVNAPFHDSDMIRPDKMKIWIDHLHKAQNFCKHADDDLGDILQYETEIVRFCIFEACHLFRHLSSDKHLKYHQSFPGNLYVLWFSMKYPELLKDPKKFHSFLSDIGLPKNFDPDNWEILKIIAEKFRIK